MPPSIFQQIVLPYLAHRSLPSPIRFSRFFSSSIAQTRAPASTQPSSSTSTSNLDLTSRPWDYVPPISPVAYDTGHDPPGSTPGTASSSRTRRRASVQPRSLPLVQKNGYDAGDVLAFLRGLEESKSVRKETLLMALEKIASIPEVVERQDISERDMKARKKGPTEMPLSRLESKKGQAKETEDISATSVTQARQTTGRTETSLMVALPKTTPLDHSSLDMAISDNINTSRTPLTELNLKLFPLVIYSLLRARLYRLAVYHLLQTPEYAVDQPLLDRVAGWIKGDGAGKLARRLERGWDGTLASIAERPSTVDEGEVDYDSSSTYRIPFGSELRLPPDAWLAPRRAAAHLLPPANERTMASLTANYNSHLTRALLSPKKSSSTSAARSNIGHSSNPLTPMNHLLTSTQPLQRPSGGMRQLRQLLKKIERLESHRSFRPDWVTANLVVKCWMNCLMASGQGWKAGRKNANGAVEDIDRRMELRGIFAFVRALFEKGAQEQAMRGANKTLAAQPARLKAYTSQVTPPLLKLDNPRISSVGPQHPSNIPQDSPAYPYLHSLSYFRHVRPFSNDILRAFRQINDMESVGRVIGWQRDMRERMGEDPEEWLVGPRSKSKVHPRRRQE